METTTNVAILPTAREKATSPDLLTALRQYQFMPQLLREIVIDRAIEPLTCSESDQELAKLQFYQHHHLDTPAAVEAWFHYYHLTPVDLERMALRKVKIEKFKQHMWGHQLNATYLKRKSSLDQVTYSLLRTQNQGIAQELYYRIQSQEQSFADLACQFSEGVEKQTGGRMGPVPLSQPHPAIRQLLTVSQPGQLWSPRQVDGWFVILRLEQLTPAQLTPAVAQYLLNEQFETWVQTQVAQQRLGILHALGMGPLTPRLNPESPADNPKALYREEQAA